MEYLHRVLIGVSGGVARTSETFQQEQTNKIAFHIGQQLAKEMLERGVIRDDMRTKAVIEAAMGEVKLADTFSVKGDGNVALTISNCNVCPKKIGKYAIKETACPMPGIIRGVLSSVMKDGTQMFPTLSPGEVCKISFKTLD